jgi:hypothetical protein
MTDITPAQLETLREQLSPLIGIQFDVLRIPRHVLAGFEPGQVGSAVGVLMDGCIPQLNLLLPDNELVANIGLSRHVGAMGSREGYPDFAHISGLRAELKAIYVDPIDVTMKKPPTRREPSARLTQKVTFKNVHPETDTLLLVAHQLQPYGGDPEIFSPTIVNLAVLSMVECIRARDHRLINSPGMWIGDYETPVILSKEGKKMRNAGELVDAESYGRKASEGKHYNEDTNFGKMKRIPYKPLHIFLRDVGAHYCPTGDYPERWAIPKVANDAFSSLGDAEDAENESTV